MEERAEIEWSNQALTDLDSIYNFLLIHWTEKEAETFLDLTLQFQKLISQFPSAFAVSRKRKAYRLGLIHRNITAVYRVDHDKITIISLVDNRSRSKYR